MHRYDNLVDHPRPVPKLPMDRMKRAAQFAPFAALTGFDDKIKETSRLTDREISLDENEWEDLQYQLEYLQEHALVLTSFQIRRVVLLDTTRDLIKAISTWEWDLFSLLETISIQN